MSLLFLSKGKGQVMLSTVDLKSTYEAQGFALTRQLFTPDEVAWLREHYMRLNTRRIMLLFRLVSSILAM